MNSKLERESIRRELDNFLTALMLLTRLPVMWLKAPKIDSGGALAWYPLVGLLIGLIIMLPLALQSVSGLLLAAVILALWVLVTGALHLDGLADMVDGWVGGLGDKAKTLRIMKDPSVGAMASVALTVILLLKFAALSQLLMAELAGYLWPIPVLARLALLPVFQYVPAASSEGMAAAVKNNLPEKRSQISAAIVLVVLVLCLPLKLLAVWLMVGLVVFLIWRSAVLKRLQGFNGDCVGALVELLELALLLAVALLGPSLV